MSFALARKFPESGIRTRREGQKALRIHAALIVRRGKMALGRRAPCTCIYPLWKTCVCVCIYTRVKKFTH